MNKMEKLYLKAKAAYYEGKEIMSDADFDELELKIKKENPNNPVLSVVGYSSKRFEFKHKSKMLSLGKIQVNDELESEFEEIEKWCKRSLNEGDFIIQPKYDGNSLSALYEDGKLVRVLTRGDGESGFDVTSKINIPKTISFKGTTEIRGECLTGIEEFAKLNSNGEFKNERNFVAGVLSDSKKNPYEKNLHFVAFSITEQKADKYSTLLKHLESDGFEISDYWFNSLSSTVEIKSFYSKMKSYRESSKYRLDGYVIKVDDFALRERLGSNSHHPLSEVAIKFPAKRAETIIRDVEWTISSHGELVPTALLEPVYLDGSTVSRAYLANLKNMLKNGYLPGAKVGIQKKGDIIPQITVLIQKVDLTEEQIEDLKPKSCPFCSSPIDYDEDFTHIKCSNKECPEMMIKKFYKNIQILGMKNVGPAMVKRLYNSGIKNVMELLSNRVTEEFLISKDEFKKGREVERLLESISTIKTIEFADMLRLEQVKGVGKSITKMLARFYLGAEHSFAGFDKSLVEFMTQRKDYYFTELPKKWEEETSVKIIYPSFDNEEEKVLAILTGSPKSAGYPTKKYFLDRFIDIKETKSFKEATMLITNDLNSTSSKMKKAQKNGLKIVTYESFNKE